MTQPTAIDKHWRLQWATVRVYTGVEFGATIAASICALSILIPHQLIDLGTLRNELVLQFLLVFAVFVARTLLRVSAWRAAFLPLVGAPIATHLVIRFLRPCLDCYWGGRESDACDDVAFALPTSL